MSNEIKNLDDAVNITADLVNEMGRIADCNVLVVQANDILQYLETVQKIALKYKELGTLLSIRLKPDDDDDD